MVMPKIYADFRNADAHGRVDKTALRPIITQSIHYVDCETGDNYNTRTAWGPIKFGFCGRVIDKIERLCEVLRTGAEQSCWLAWLTVRC